MDLHCSTVSRDPIVVLLLGIAIPPSGMSSASCECMYRMLTIGLVKGQCRNQYIQASWTELRRFDMSVGDYHKRGVRALALFVLAAPQMNITILGQHRIVACSASSTSLWMRSASGVYTDIYSCSPFLNNVRAIPDHSQYNSEDLSGRQRASSRVIWVWSCRLYTSSRFLRISHYLDSCMNGNSCLRLRLLLVGG